jgi:dinuclear metal center YbgI/SA1388 family protein
MPTVTDLVEFLERFAPPRLAAEWDNVGLLLGERKQPVKRVLTCLTVTPASTEEAVAEKAELIVSHHPVLFRPAKRLTDSTADGRLLLPLLRAGVAVYSPHTAFDNTRDGINDILAQKLGLKDIGPLKPRPGDASCKVIVFVPEKDLAAVSDALFNAGAGRIGEYRECSFRVSGTGTFYGTEAASPTVGQKGRREEVSELRLETVCPEHRLSAVLDAMRKAHSYEEPAFDVVPLRAGSSDIGEGRIGTLAKPATLKALAGQVKKLLKADSVGMVGEPQKKVQRVAIVCGAGGEMLHDATRARADVFLTGEMRFHDCVSAETQGVGVLLPGHYATERIGVEELASRLQARWSELRVWPSKREKDPIEHV